MTVPPLPVGGVRRGRIGGRAAWETEVTAVMEVLLAFAASAEHRITPG